MNNMFSPESGAGESSQLIPAGTLHFAQFHPQEIRTSKSGGRYASIELTLIDGPYERRKIWTLIMDPLDPKNVKPELRAEGKADGAQMGLTALTRILESAGVFNIGNPATYRQFDGATFEQILAAADLKKVAIKIKVKKGTDGYEDKNDVGEWLSPNPKSGGHRAWLTLIGGPDSIAAARQNAFNAGPVIPPVAKPQAGSAPGWLTKPSQGNEPF